LKKVDEKHFEETNRERKIVHYKSKFKKKKMIIPGKQKEMNGLRNNSVKTIIFSIILASVIQ